MVSVEDPSDEQPDSWRQVDPKLRALAVAAVGAAVISWWPAFTLGAYQTVFFEQLLALWAASTAAFLILVIFKQRRAVSWPRRLALLLPSVWLLVAFALPTGTEAGHSAALFWFALALSGFALGRLNPHFLSCDDFTISGNSQPPGCTPGPATFR